MRFCLQKSQISVSQGNLGVETAPDRGSCGEGSSSKMGKLGGSGVYVHLSFCGFEIETLLVSARPICQPMLARAYRTREQPIVGLPSGGRDPKALALWSHTRHKRHVVTGQHDDAMIRSSSSDRS